MALGRFIEKSLFFLTVIALSYSSPEVHTFSVRFGNETINGVAETDVENNWMSHHVFPSSQAQGVTIGRDHDLGVEVFVQDRQKEVCYARAIEEETESPLDIQAHLQLLEEHHQTMEVSRVLPVEYLECTGELVDPATLGRVKYLCQDKAIYRLRKLKRTKRTPRILKAKCWVCVWCKKSATESQTPKAMPMSSCVKTVYIKTCEAKDEAK